MRLATGRDGRVPEVADDPHGDVPFKREARRAGAWYNSSPFSGTIAFP
jgi:hypothetical protein